MDRVPRNALITIVISIRPNTAENLRTEAERRGLTLGELIDRVCTAWVARPPRTKRLKKKRTASLLERRDAPKLSGGTD